MLNQSPIVPPGHRGAFIMYADSSGVRSAVAFKNDSGWEVWGTVGYHPHEPEGLDAGLNIMKTW